MLSVDNTQSINSETCSMVSKEGTPKKSNHDELQYLKLIQSILDNGTRKEDRTGKLFNSFLRRNKNKYDAALENLWCRCINIPDSCTFLLQKFFSVGLFLKGLLRFIIVRKNKLKSSDTLV